jgi:hypothetical protein
MRCVYSQTARDTEGNIVVGATVRVYLAGTTTPATFYQYADSASATTGVTTGSDGAFTFYIDRFDYDSDQKFKIIISKGSTTTTYDDIEIDRAVLGTYTISTDKTVTTHITVPKGVIYSVDSGKTLTFSGSLTSGPYQIFSGSGTVSGLDKVVPEWFGSTGDGTADDTSAVASAIASSTNGTWDTTGYTYIVSNVSITGNVVIKGSGTLKHKAASSDHMIEVTGSLSLQDVTIDGNKANQTGRYSTVYFTGDKLSAQGSTFQNTVHTGIYNADGVWMDIDNCLFTGMAEHSGTFGGISGGIYINQSTEDMWFSVRNSRFIGAAPDGGNGYTPFGVAVHAAQSGKCRGVIYKNYLTYCGQVVGLNNLAAIDLYQLSDRVIVEGNTIENSGFTAIIASDADGVSIVRNKVRDAYYNVTQPAIYFQGYNHSTTLKHNVEVSFNDIDWQYGNGINLQGNVGQLTKNPRLVSNNVRNGYYNYYLRYVDSADLEGNISSDASVEGIRIRDAQGRVRISGGNIKNSADYHIRTAGTVTSLDLDVLNVEFDTAGNATNAVSVVGLKNVKYIGNTHLNTTGTYSTVIQDCTGKVTVIGNSYDKAPLYKGNAALERVADGFLTTGGFQRLSVEATANIEADASTTITLGIPTSSRLIGVQLRVDSALATGETWDAAWSGGSTTSIATARAVAKNTKVTLMYDEHAATPITSNTTNIAITKNGGGNFTAQGTIRAIAYYEVMNAMGDAP